MGVSLCGLSLKYDNQSIFIFGSLSIVSSLRTTLHTRGRST